MVHEFHEYEGRKWPVVIGYLLAALAVAFAVVFFGRWVYRASVGTGGKNPAEGHLKQVSLKITATENGKSSGSSSNASKGGLPNNGPGGSAALFGATVLISSSLHYAIKRRRDA